MEFSQCFTILQSRGKSAPTENEVCSCLKGNNVPSAVSSQAILCNTCEDSNALSVNTTNAVVDSMTSTAVNISEKELLLSILDNFIRFQEERVQVYKEFDGTLKSLIEHNLISQYSENCIGVTAKFSLISNQVINLQKHLLKIEYGKVAADLISRVQKAEKEKLLLVAAKHLDLLQDSVPSLHTLTGGKSAAQQVYLQRQISQVESSIAEALEEVQALRCDLILGADDIY